MTTETKIILVKCFCVTTVGLCTTLVAGLAQWATGGEWPNPIAWMVILFAAVGNACDKLGAFLSQGFSNYLSRFNNGQKKEP